MKTFTLSTKHLTVSAVVLSFFLFLPKDTYANGTTISISPSLFQIEAKPPADVWAPFVLKNTSTQPVTLSIGYKAFDPQASHNGNVVFLKNGQLIQGEDKKIFDKMQVVDDNNLSQNTFSLAPKQSTQLRLHISLPNNEPSSDYYFSLIFLQTSNQPDQNVSNNTEAQRSSSTLQAGIGANILLAVGDKQTPQGTIDTFQTPWFVQSGPVSFTLTVFNDGAHFIAPSGKIMIKNMFGQTVGKIDLPNTVILAGTGRTLSSKNSTISANQTDGQEYPQAFWQEPFLLGMYTATATISLSDAGPIYIRSIHFFAFPLEYLIGFFVFIVFIYVIYLRVKRRIK